MPVNNNEPAYEPITFDALDSMEVDYSEMLDEEQEDCHKCQ